jgi:hypothetical protein
VQKAVLSSAFAKLDGLILLIVEPLAVGAVLKGTPQLQETAMAAHAQPTKDEIIALERSYWDAMKQKDGGRAAALSGKTSLVTGTNGVMCIAKEKMGKMTEEGD